MADQISISVRVVDSEVGPKLRQIRDQLKAAYGDAERSAKGLGQTNQTVLKSFEAIKLSALGSLSGRARLGAELGESGAGARKLVEGLHGLEPLLGSVGLGLSNMRGFAAAARFGLVGFAAVAAGAVALGLEKIADKSEQAKKNIKDLGGSPADFETLRKGARDLGTDVGTLGAIYENYAKSRGSAGGAAIIVNPYSQQGERKFPGASSTDNFVTLAKAFQVGAGNIEGGTKDLQTFFQGTAKAGGRLTADVAGGLSAGSARQLEKILGLAEPAAGSRLTPQQQLAQQLGPQGRSLIDFEGRVQQQAPRIEKEFAAKPVDLGDSVSRFTASVTSALPATTALGGAINALTQKMNQAADAAQKAASSPQFGPPAPRRDTTGAFRRAVDATAPENQSSDGDGFSNGGQISLRGFAGGGSINPNPFVGYDDSDINQNPFGRGSKHHGDINQNPFGGGSRSEINANPFRGGSRRGSINPRPFGSFGFSGINPNPFRGGSRHSDINPHPFVDAHGIIHGPGTGTSDSILARVNRGVIRLSRDEGIVNARAMRRLGSRGLDQLNSYADGGTPGPFVAAHSSGASSGKTVNINLTLGGNTFPVTADESVGERLVQETIAWRIASGGRRQSSIS